MLFSTTTFLFVFLPIVLGAYFLCPRRGRNLVLLIASLIFYAWGEIRYLLVMVAKKVVVENSISRSSRFLSATD